MISEKQFMRGVVAALTVGVCVIGYNQTRARADGIPAARPLTYAGSLEEGGAPVTGTRNLRLTIWDDATSTDSVHTRCITSAPGATVTDGRFQVVLDAACVGVVRSTPDLWLEIEVNGGSLGRTKLSAVPFAVEAGRANELTPNASNALIPTGTIVAFGGRPDRVPAGWLLCDGRSVTRAMYPTLFDAIGTSHGGDGTNFNLPDLRGRFLRGVDGDSGRDPDRAARTAANAGGNAGDAVGSVQGSAMQTHNHRANINCAGVNWPNGGTNNCALSVYDYNRTNTYFNETTGLATYNAGTSSETRPVNVAVHYIIKI